MGCVQSQFDKVDQGVQVTDTPFNSVYEVTGVHELDGAEVDMSKFAADKQVLLCMTIATNNKRTKAQLEGLEELRAKYEDQGMVVMVFPCNDFGNQPADKAAVRAACEAAGYKGWVMEFVSIRGPEAHPLWTYFRLKDPQNTMPATADLAKALTNRKGEVFGRWSIGAMPHIIDQFLQPCLKGWALNKHAVDPRYE